MKGKEFPTRNILRTASLRVVVIIPGRRAIWLGGMGLGLGFGLGVVFSSSGLLDEAAC